MLLYEIGLELTILFAFWLCLGVWQRDPSTPGRSTFVALGLAASLWCLGELAFQREVFSEVTADRIRYAGILGLAPMWLGVAGHGARLELARRVPWFPLVLLAPPACLYALMYMGSWSSLFFTTVPGGPDHLGPLWWVSAGYSYVLVLAGCVLFGRSALRRDAPRHWSRRMALGLAALVPLAGNAAFIASGLRWPLDPTPALIGLTLIVLRGALFRGGLLEALPIAQHDLIQQLPVGVILTDRFGVVIDMNGAAERRIGVAEASALGRTLDAVLSEAGDDVRADISPLWSHDREAGQIVLLDADEKDL